MRSICVPAPVRDKWQRWTDLLAEVSKASAVRLALVDGDDLLIVAAGGQQRAYEPGERLALKGSGVYCGSVVRSADRLSVHDPAGDLTWHMLNPDWKRNPDMERGMVSYLGLPITLPEGGVCGTVSILDRQPTPFAPLVQGLLAEFCEVAGQDLRRMSLEAARAALVQGAGEGVLLLDSRPGMCECNQRFLVLWQLSGGELDPEDFSGIVRALASKAGDPRAAEQQLSGLLANGDEDGLSIALADGRTLRLRSRAARDQAGNVWGRVWLCGDQAGDSAQAALGNVDAATGLATSRYFQEIGYQEVSRAKRYGKELSLILLRLDGLERAIQDHGRGAGEELLAGVAACGTQVVRNLDIFGRLEDDLLGVLLPETGQEGASAMAGRLRAVVDGAEHLAGGEPVYLKARLGIATFSRELASFESLLNLAETAMDNSGR